MSLMSIRKKGYLFKLPVSSGTFKKWNKRWFVLHATTHDGVVRLDYYEQEDHEAAEIAKRTIPLRECMGLSTSVGTRTHPHVFEFKSPLGIHMLAAPSETERCEWMEAIKEAITEDMFRRKKKKAPGPPTVKRVVKKDGSIAVKTTRKGSVYDPLTSGIYRVTLHQNETTKRLNLSGNYNLEVTPTGISLVAANSGASITEWQYKHIKSYGKRGENLTLESGRLSEVGEGTFIFMSSCGKEIFGMINRNIRALKMARDAAKAETVDKVVARKKSRSETSTATKRLSATEKYQVTTDVKPHPRPHRPAPYIPSGAAGVYRRSTELDGATGYGDPHSLPSSSSRKSPDMPSRRHRGAIETPPPSYDEVTQRGRPHSTRLSRGSSAFEGSFDNPLATMEEDDELPPITRGVANPLTDIEYTNLDDTNVDYDRLFDALDQMELNDDEPDIGEDLELAAEAADRQRPLPPPQVRSTKAPPLTKKLSQQEFDQMWDDICATLPDVSETDFLP